MTHHSLAEIPEDRLVGLLLSDQHWRSRVIRIHGFPDNPCIAQRVLLNDAPGGVMGDVDILLCEAQKPRHAIAIEAKRVKVGSNAFVSGTPNKLHEYEKAVQQANKLAKLGFWQVYLFVFVAVDSREQNKGANTFAGMTQELEYAIESVVTTNNLHDRVGLIKFDFTQPMDHPPLGPGSYGARVVRLARVAHQPQDLTNWVEKAMSANAIRT